MNLGSPDDDLIHFSKKVTKKEGRVNPVRKFLALSLMRRRLTRDIRSHEEIAFIPAARSVRSKFARGTPGLK
jgi:hypothetical protein